MGVTVVPIDIQSFPPSNLQGKGIVESMTILIVGRVLVCAVG